MRKNFPDTQPAAITSVISTLLGCNLEFARYHALSSERDLKDAELRDWATLAEEVGKALKTCPVWAST